MTAAASRRGRGRRLWSRHAKKRLPLQALAAAATSCTPPFRQACINNVDAVDMLAARLAAAGLEDGAGPRIDLELITVMVGRSLSSESEDMGISAAAGAASRNKAPGGTLEARPWKSYSHQDSRSSFAKTNTSIASKQEHRNSRNNKKQHISCSWCPGQGRRAGEGRARRPGPFGTFRNTVPAQTVRNVPGEHPS